MRGSRPHATPAPAGPRNRSDTFLRALVGAMLLLLTGPAWAQQGGLVDRPLFPRNPPPRQSIRALNIEGLSKTIPGVPEYIWWYGCSPTAGGMIIGWWDAQTGCEDLFEGSAATWYGSGTSGTKRMVASQAHIDAGALLGLTYGSYENHTADCIADFFFTRNGSTSRSNIGPGFVAFAAWDDPTTTTNESYTATYETNYTDYGWTYEDFCAEIDAGRPVHLGLTSSAGGHSVTAIGYDNTDGKRHYICWTTWSGWGVRSWAWDGEDESGYDFQVYGGTCLIITPRSAPNNPPTAPTSVVISPTNPDTSTDLAASASGSNDPDGDTVAYEYQWARSTDGGSTWSAWGWEGNTLDDGYTARDERWKAQARATDGKGGYSDWVESPVVTIANTPPTAPSTVTVTPGAPITTDDLLVSASGSTDADGDGLTYQYQWAKSTDGGSTWSEWGNDGEALAASATAKEEQWKARARASDGTDSGPWQESSAVTILNSAPGAPGTVIVTPGSPVTGQALTATASGSTDADNDSLTYEYQWCSSSDGGATWSAWNYEGMELAGSNVARGQSWKARARASDGEASGDWLESETVSVGNAPPTAPLTVGIRPLKPRTANDLVASASGSTDEEDDSLTYRYTWARSTDGGNTWSGWDWAGTVLPSSNTSKGEHWKVRGRAYDGTVAGPWTEGAIVIIGNTPPTAPAAVTISPSQPRGDQDLKAAASGATDVDGDSLTYRYAWYKSTDGGVTWQAGPLGRILAASATAVGEWWRVQARANDGTVSGPWTVSAAVQIQPEGEAALALGAAAVPTRSGTLAITVSLSTAAEVGATVLNLAGRVVAAVPAQALNGGISTLWWNGRSTTGTRVPQGQYLLRVQARSRDGGCVTCLVPLRK